MIELKRKQNCSGCTACMSVCPKSCITMAEDSEGFIYPVTDRDVCINCNACNRVCPVLKLQKDKASTAFSAETKAYAAYITDEKIRLSSSSGGVFTALASATICAGGVVYGAAWNNDEVRHIKVESLPDISLLRGSKYVQSSIGGIFREIREYLKHGRKVLFSGTPCQVAGLKSFLKQVENLILVEVACHGAPSPKALQKYFEEIHNQYSYGLKLDFRSKPDGNWQDYKVTAHIDGRYFFFENQKENVFMKGFLRELYSRPICHDCPFKSGASGADITLADFWGIENVLPDFPYKPGVNLVLTHTEKGDILFATLPEVIFSEVSVSEAIKRNSALKRSEAPHPERMYFFRNIEKYRFTELVEKCIGLRAMTRFRLRLNAYMKKLAVIKDKE